ncbi:MAG: hypothetical protein QXJ96_02535 [Candidatus Aenigmatarchaeota archaeon]|nr:hypothetical protein [Candidatus Aenigmarchaeota archaeon]
MEDLNPNIQNHFLYEGLPEIYNSDLAQNSSKLNKNENFANENCISDFDLRILLEIAKQEEDKGNFEHAAVAYKFADRFGDYLRCMDVAIRIAEEEKDYHRATILAEQIASEDVVETYRRLERLKSI